MLRRLLIANRAEIAARIVRTARARGTETVAVYSDPDAALPYVQMADAAVHLPGAAPGDTYLHVASLLEAAARCGADSVHPGYGFLSENAEFARACIDAGLTFVGPPPEVIEAMGSKIRAKTLMATAGVPVLEGRTVGEATGPAELGSLGTDVGYPLLVKASAGGGGRGMRVVRAPEELADAVAAASREAASAFGDGTVFLERYLEAPRHVEVQVLADAHGTVAHLFERECSIQRRHQKVVEETPSPGISPSTRAAICEAAVTAARAIGYVNAGTVEFVVDRDERFSFLEVNTRLQVEHPVTELVTGLDLVEHQLRVAEGRPLGEEVLSAASRGHAIEVRLYAEDAEQGFLPASGTLSRFEVPLGEGVRVDAGYASGSVVSTSYDAMLAKVIAWGETREIAARRLARALRTARLHGVTTNRDLLVGILSDPEFLSGATDTGFLERRAPAQLATSSRDADERLACVAAALWQRAAAPGRSPLPAGLPPGWRNVGPSNQPRAYGLRGTEHQVLVRGRPASLVVELDGERVSVDDVVVDGATITARIAGRRVACELVEADGTVYVDGSLGAVALVAVPRLHVAALDEAPGSMHAPLPGVVRRVAVTKGATVAVGDVLLVLEAMKMEHAVRAPHDGMVTEVVVAEGDQVEGGAMLAVVEPIGGEG